MEGLALWKALTCFGQEQVNKVLQDPQQRSTYPKLFETLDSANKRARYDTIIPPSLLKEIASTEPYLYVFAFRGDELICRDRIERIPTDFKIILPLEALERFGGDLMLAAVDYGTSKIT
jgi:hypothetical protein